MRRSVVAFAGVLAVISSAAVAADSEPKHAQGGVLRGGVMPAQTPPAIDQSIFAKRSGATDVAPEQSAVPQTAGLVAGKRTVVVDSQTLAEASDPVTGLRGTVEAAIASSDRLRAVAYDAKAAEKVVLRELAAYMPVITANAGQSIDEGISDSRDGQSRYASLNLSMPLFTSGRRYYDVQGAKSIARAASFRTAIARDGVVLETAEAYLQHVYGEMAEAAIVRSEKTMRRLLSSLRAQHRAGFASGADVAEVTAELGAIEQQLVEVRATQAKAQDKVNSFAARRVAIGSEFPKLDEALAAGREPLLASALQRNPNLLAAAHTADASQSSSSSAFARYLPQVSLNAEYRRLYGEIRDFGEDERMNVGVRVSVPLVDLSTVASIGESRMRAKADQYRSADMRRNVQTQFNTLWEEYKSGTARETIARQRIVALTKVKTAANARFLKGLIGLDLLLDAERKLTSGEIELAQLKVANTLVATQILVTSGIFTPAMLDI